MQCFQNRCTELFKRKKYFRVRCTLKIKSIFFCTLPFIFMGRFSFLFCFNWKRRFLSTDCFFIFCHLLLLENGRMRGILVGIVTSRDIDFVHEPDMSGPIKEIRRIKRFDFLFTDSVYCERACVA